MSLIHRLREEGFLDERELVEQGVSVVQGVVRVGGVARWRIKRYQRTSALTDETLNRECAAYHLRDAVPSLAEIMPRFIGTFGDDMILIEATSGLSMWEKGSPSLAASVVGAMHRDNRESGADLCPLPWILRCMDVDAPTHAWDTLREPLRKIGARSGVVAALRHLRAAWCTDTFIHGNAHLHNVLMGSNGRLQFVNWGSAGRGEPAWDLAALCLQPVLSRVRRTPAVGIWWAQIVKDISMCFNLHAKIYGRPVDPQTVVEMMGAWVLQLSLVAVAERREGAETDAGLTAACDILENAKGYSTDLEYCE